MHSDQQNQNNISIEKEIMTIFETLTGQRNLSEQTVARIKQLLKVNIQDIIEQAMHRSLWRDPNSVVIDQKDLLHVITKCSSKYKNRIGFSIFKSQDIKPIIDAVDMKQSKIEQVYQEGNSEENSEDIKKYIQDKGN